MNLNLDFLEKFYFLDNERNINIILNKELIMAEDMNEIAEQLEENGYDFGVAIATNAEVEAGAACGQLSIITENDE